MKCIPCRVTYDGKRYQINRFGIVSPALLPGCGPVAPMPEEFAKLVRAEAARQRRNRNVRERHEALTGLGLQRVRGALGGVYYE